MATVLSTLYPPLVDTFMPAFVDTESAYIKFSVSPYNSRKDIKYLHVSLVNQKTNIKALAANNAAVGSNGLNRDDVTIQDGIAIYKMDSNLISYDKNTELYTVHIPPSWLRSPITTSEGEAAFSVEGFYKAQIRFDENFEKNPFNTSDYLITGRSLFSEWSSVCLLKAIPKPIIELKQFEDGAIPTFNPGVIPVTGQVIFSSENLTGKDAETVRSYQISIFNTENPAIVVDTSGVIFTANSADPNQIYWLADGENETLPLDQEYTVEITVTTKNQYKFTESFIFKLANFLDYTDFQPVFTFKKVALLSYELEENEDVPSGDESLIQLTTEEDGIVEFNVSLDIGMPPGYLYIKRSRLENGAFRHWELLSCTKEANIINRNFVDMTVCSLEQYAYSAQYQMKDSDLFTRSVSTWNNTHKEMIYPNFYDMFLSRNGVQLAVRYDGKVNSLQPVVNRQKIDTLGGKYPRFAENAQMNYKQFSITGYIDAESDFNRRFLSDVSEKYAAAIETYNTQMDGKYIVRNDTFADGDRTYLNSGDGYLKKFADSTLHDLYPKDNWWWQREFREQALKWLNNGEPKLFRSMPEGNMAVMLTDISLTPNHTIGRRLYTFSATMYEIEDGHSLDTLATLGIISVPNEKAIDAAKDEEEEGEDTQDVIFTVGQLFSQEISGDWEVVNNSGSPTGQGQKGFDYSQMTLADKAYYMDYESGSVLGQRYQAVPDSLKLKDVRLEFETPPKWYYFKGDKILPADTTEPEYEIFYTKIADKDVENGWFKDDVSYYQLTNNNYYRIVSDEAQKRVEKNPRSAGYLEKTEGYAQWTGTTETTSKENLFVPLNNIYTPLNDLSLYTRKNEYKIATEYSSDNVYYKKEMENYTETDWPTLGEQKEQKYFEQRQDYVKVTEAPNDINNIPQPWENEINNWYKNISTTTTSQEYESITPNTEGIPFQKYQIVKKASFSDGVDFSETYYQQDKENGITTYRETVVNSLNVLEYAYEKSGYTPISKDMADPDSNEIYYRYNASTEKYEVIPLEEVPGLADNEIIYYRTYYPVSKLQEPNPTQNYKWDTDYYLQDEDFNYVLVDVTDYYCTKEYRKVDWENQIINTSETYYYINDEGTYIPWNEEEYNKAAFFYEEQMRRSDNYTFDPENSDTQYYIWDEEESRYVATDVFNDYIYELMKVRSADNVNTIKANLQSKYYKKEMVEGKAVFKPLLLEDLPTFYTKTYDLITGATLNNIKARSEQGELFYGAEPVYEIISNGNQLAEISTIYEQVYTPQPWGDSSLETLVADIKAGEVYYMKKSATSEDYTIITIKDLKNDFSGPVYTLSYTVTTKSKEEVQADLSSNKYYYQKNSYYLLDNDFIQSLDTIEDADFAFYSFVTTMIKDIYEKETEQLYLKTEDSLATIEKYLSSKKKYFKYDTQTESYIKLTLDNMGGDDWGVKPGNLYQQRYRPITKDILLPEDLVNETYYQYSQDNQEWNEVTKEDLPQYYVIKNPQRTELYPYQEYKAIAENTSAEDNLFIEGYVIKVDDSSADMSNPEDIDEDFHYEQLNTEQWWSSEDNIYYYIQNSYFKSEDHVANREKEYYIQNEDGTYSLAEVSIPTYYQQNGYSYPRVETEDIINSSIKYYYSEEDVYKELPSIYLYTTGYFLTEDIIWSEDNTYYKEIDGEPKEVPMFSIVDLDIYFIQDQREKEDTSPEDIYPHALGYKVTLTIPNPKPTEDNNKPLELNIFVDAKGYYQVPSNLDVLNIKLYDSSIATINYKLTYNTAYNTSIIPTSVDLADNVVGQVSGWWTAQTNISNLIYQKYKKETYDPVTGALQSYTRFSNWNSLSFDVTPYAVFEIQYFNAPTFESYVVGRTGRFNLLRDVYDISELRFLGRRMALAAGHKPINLDEWEFFLDDSAKTEDDAFNSNLTWNEFIEQSVTQTDNLVDISTNEDGATHYTTTSIREGINRLWNNDTQEQIASLGGYTSISAIKNPQYNTVYGIRDESGNLNYVIYYIDENWYPVIFNDNTTILAQVPISGMVNYKGKIVTTSYD